MNELTVNTTQMNQNANNILKFKSFSAWYVFFLNRITQHIYPLYWMYTRSKVINSIHKHKVNMTWFYIMMISFIHSTYMLILIDFIDSDSYFCPVAVLSIFLAVLLCLISYFVLIFKIKKRLQDIMNSNTDEYYFSNIFTFLWGDIYLQYKINKCIDDCRDISNK